MSKISYTITSNFSTGDYVWCRVYPSLCSDVEELLYKSLIKSKIKGIEKFCSYHGTVHEDVHTTDYRFGQCPRPIYIMIGQVVSSDLISSTPFFRHLVKLITGETRYFTEFDLRPYKK